MKNSSLNVSTYIIKTISNLTPGYEVNLARFWHTQILFYFFFPFNGKQKKVCILKGLEILYHLKHW